MTMRQIDADNLWEVLRGEEGAKVLNHSPVKLMDIKQIIDNAPTIDAIPVEWLNNIMLNGDNEDSKAAWRMLHKWNNEHFADFGRMVIIPLVQHPPRSL